MGPFHSVTIELTPLQTEVLRAGGDAADNLKGYFAELASLIGQPIDVFAYESRLEFVAKPIPHAAF